MFLTSPVTNTNLYSLSIYLLSHSNLPSVKVNIDEGFLNLMTQDGTPKDDVKVPEGDLGTQIQTDFDEGKDLLVTIVSAMGEEQVGPLIHFCYSTLLSRSLFPRTHVLLPPFTMCLPSLFPRLSLLKRPQKALNL